MRNLLVLHVSLVVAFGVLSTSCKKEEEEKALIKTSLISTGDLDLSLSLTQSKTINLNAADLRGAGTVESLNVPVHNISLAESLADGVASGKSINIYNCPEAEDADCMLDLIEDGENLLASASESGLEVEDPAGTYKVLTINHCGGSETTYTNLVTAYGWINGSLYETSEDDATKTYASDAEEAEITSVEDVCKTHFVLPEAIVVTGDKDNAVEHNIYMYANPYAMVYFANNEPDDAVACGGNDDDIFVCVDKLAVTANITETEITTESHYIINSDNAYSVLSVLLNEDEEPIGGSLRPYYLGTVLDYTISGLSEGGFVKSVTLNSDDTFEVTQFDSDGEDHVMFEELEREDTATTGTYDDVENGEDDYRAIQFDTN